MKHVKNSKSPIIGIIGLKNCGKTTLISKLIAHLVTRDYRVSTIKHAHHHFDIDHENRDSYKHRQAGAGEVLITSQKRWAIIHELKEEKALGLQEAVDKLSPCDIILVEGFKQHFYPKIKLLRADETPDEDLYKESSIIAIIYPDKIGDIHMPAFHRDRIDEIADFICAYIKEDSI